jgi:hypothetical protein
MIQFLNSALAPLLAAAFIPLLIHLFNRTKTKKIKFSSLQFLHILENKRIKRLRIYQILLIIIRTLLILFLALSFLRPVLKDSKTPAGSQSAAVIFLDNSYSMQRYMESGSLFDLQRDVLKKLLEHFTEKDRLLILYGDTALQHKELEGFKKELGSLEAQNHYFNLDKAVAKALDFFEKNLSLNNEFFLLSDLAFKDHMLSDSLLSELLESNIHLFAAPMDVSKMKNITIDSVVVDKQKFSFNHSISIIVYLRKTKAADSECEVELFLNNKRLAAAYAQFENANTASVELNFHPSGSGLIPLKIEIMPDDLELDNAWYLTIDIPETIEALYVSDRRSLNLTTALDAISQTGKITFKKTSFSQWQQENPSQYDALVLDHPSPFSQSLQRKVKAFIQNSSLVFLIPGEQTASENLLLKNLGYDLRYHSYYETNGENQYYALENIDQSHIYFGDLFEKQSKQTNETKLFKYHKMIGNGKTLIRLQNGDPYLISFSGGAGHLFAFSAPFENDWSDIALKGFFAPVLYSLFNNAYFFNKRTSYAFPEAHILKINPAYTASSDYFIRYPEGDSLKIIPKQSTEKQHFYLEDITQPGHYRLYNKNELIHILNVNFDKKEALSGGVKMEKLRKKINGLSPNKDMGKQISLKRTGKELWLYFLIAAIMMLLTEIFLIRLIENRPVNSSANNST